MPKIEIYSKPNCSYCVHAKDFLKENSLQYTEYKLDVDFTRDQIKEKFPEASTYPIILVNNYYIGGFVDLKEWLKENTTYLYEGAWNGA